MNGAVLRQSANRRWESDDDKLFFSNNINWRTANPHAWQIF
jgi:ribonucleotide reductase alpha subunit